MAVEDTPERSSLGFESVEAERADTVAVEGRLPDWLAGTFVRNGPGLFEAGGRSIDHWFDGPALLRAFGFDPASAGASEDRVHYANRFLRTEAYAAAKEGRVENAGFAESAQRGLLDRLRNLFPEPTDNANAAVANVGGEYVALTESPRAVRFDPVDLSTRGELTWRDELPVGHTTPHLRPTPDDGHVGYLTEFLPRPAYRLFRVGPEEPRREEFARVSVSEPAYMHSLAVAGRFAVLVEPPFVLPPHRVLTGSGSMLDRYEWRPHRGTRFIVVDRQTGDVVCESQTPPFVVFHHANAYRAGDELVVDLVGFDSPSVFSGMYLDELRERTEAGGGGELRRYRVPLSGATPREAVVAEGVAMPTVDDRRAGQRYRHVYVQRSSDGGAAETVARVDVETETVTAWHADAYVSEPVFVPRESGRTPDETPPAEPEGVVLTEVLDPDRTGQNGDPGRTAVVVLDAETMTELGRAWAPHRLPFGFHGAYFEEV